MILSAKANQNHICWKYRSRFREHEYLRRLYKRQDNDREFLRPWWDKMIFWGRPNKNSLGQIYCLNCYSLSHYIHVLDHGIHFIKMQSSDPEYVMLRFSNVEDANTCWSICVTEWNQSTKWNVITQSSVTTKSIMKDDWDQNKTGTRVRLLQTEHTKPFALTVTGLSYCWQSFFTSQWPDDRITFMQNRDISPTDKTGVFTRIR